MGQVGRMGCGLGVSEQPAQPRAVHTARPGDLPDATSLPAHQCHLLGLDTYSSGRGHQPEGWDRGTEQLLLPSATTSVPDVLVVLGMCCRGDRCFASSVVPNAELWERVPSSGLENEIPLCWDRTASPAECMTPGLRAGSVPLKKKLHLYNTPPRLRTLFCSGSHDPDFQPDCSFCLYGPCSCQQAEMGLFCALNFCIVCPFPSHTPPGFSITVLARAVSPGGHQ